MLKFTNPVTYFVEVYTIPEWFFSSLDRRRFSEGGRNRQWSIGNACQPCSYAEASAQA